MGGRQPCSICSSPAAVRQVINNELAKNPRTKTLRELAQLSGFSRSALSRHSLSCLVKQVLLHGRSKKNSWANRRWVVAWPTSDGGFSYTLRVEFDGEAQPIERRNRDHSVIRIAASDLRDSDFIEAVVFEEPVPPRSTPIPTETKNVLQDGEQPQ